MQQQQQQQQRQQWLACQSIRHWTAHYSPPGSHCTASARFTRGRRPSILPSPSSSPASDRSISASVDGRWTIRADHAAVGPTCRIITPNMYILHTTPPSQLQPDYAGKSTVWTLVYLSTVHRDLLNGSVNSVLSRLALAYPLRILSGPKPSSRATKAVDCTLLSPGPKLWIDVPESWSLSIQIPDKKGRSISNHYP